jgi:drug/metabolite transporter (DMT)-like permease
MTLPLYVWLPLLSGLAFAISSMLLKQSGKDGVDVWRMLVISTWIGAAICWTLPAFGGGQWRWDVWYQPVIVACVFLMGQVLTLVAFERGDVSVAVPLLGTKVLFVALLVVWVLGETVPLMWWLAAGLAMAGTFAVSRQGGGHRGRAGTGALAAVVSALLFAVADVLVQSWAKGWGFTRFFPVMFTASSLLTLLFVPRFPPSRVRWSGGLWCRLGVGSALMSLQGLGVVYTLTTVGQATAANVAYNTRGIWSVLLVWIVGHWFGNTERDAGRSVMVARLVGAALLLAAVVLVVVGG